MMNMNEYRINNIPINKKVNALDFNMALMYPAIKSNVANAESIKAKLKARCSESDNNKV